MAKAAAAVVLGPRATEAVGGRLRAVRQRQAVPDLQRAQRWSLPVFLDGDLRPRWVLERGRTPHRVFLATVPKAGTYMMAQILARLDLVSCRVHVAKDEVVDLRFAPDAIARYYPSELGRRIDLQDSLRMIAPGQFAFGHIGLEIPGARAGLAGFKVVVMVRNLRDVYVSLLRYFRERRDMPLVGVQTALLDDLARLLEWDMDRVGPHRLLGFQGLARWRDEPNALCLRYEAVVGDEGRETQLDALRRLATFLGGTGPDDRLADILRTVIGQPTVTKMEEPTVAAAHWSEEAERRYRRIGFPALNRELGYPEPA